ncbi:MAG: ABC transporter permease subunit [Candidatus Limnocylindrales bacterium]
MRASNTGTLGASSATARGRGGRAAIALLPFVSIVTLFLLVPTVSLIWGSFHDSNTGAFTIANYSYLSHPIDLVPFRNSLELSLASTVLGSLVGLVIAQAIVSSRRPIVQEIATTFSSVAANFAGVPLAFAFGATLGLNGLLTVALKSNGIDIYDGGFKLRSLIGLIVVYAYWEIPLMVLVMLPPLQAMKPSWREAAEILGASRWQYLRSVAIPILMTPFISSLLLLYANAFGAYATAYGLTTGFVSLVPIEISNLTNGDVSRNLGVADALAIGLAVIMAVCIGGRAIVERRSTRWLAR